MAFEDAGLDPEMLVRAAEQLARRHGMPMALATPAYLPATIDACRAYVGARMHAPDSALALLRGLRRRAHSDGQPLDDRATIRAAAADAGLAAGTVESSLADGDVEAQLRADMAATRAPLPEALAPPHKLSRSDGGLRYSTSSAVFEHEGRRVVAPGLQPFAIYWEAAAPARMGAAEGRSARRPTNGST